MASDVAAGRQARDVTRRFRNALTGSEFTGRWASEQQPEVGDDKSIVVEVKGHAYYTGTSEFTVEEGDTFHEGFMLR